MAKVTNTGVHIVEGSAAAADTGGEGQIWVKSDTPSSLYHTDDAGTDFRINGITVGTETASTSGTAIDFTGIPAGVKKIVIMCEICSTNSTSDLLIQIGDGDGIEASGYEGVVEANGTLTAFGAGYIFYDAPSASTVWSGVINLYLKDASNNTWGETGLCHNGASNAVHVGTGFKSLTATLDRVRITSASGDTFDAGSINIQYE